MAESLHEAFGWIFFQLVRDAPRGAIVFEVDAGCPETPSLIIRAGVFEGGSEPVGAMLDGPFERVVAKEWLQQASVARCGSVDDGPRLDLQSSGGTERADA